MAVDRSISENKYLDEYGRPTKFTKYQTELDILNKDINALNANQPKYTRPEEYQKYLDLAYSNAGKSELEAGLEAGQKGIDKYINMAKTKAGTTMLPGQGQMERNIQQASQSAISSTKDITQSPMASLGAIQDIYAKQLGATNQLAMQQAQYYDQNQAQLMEALNKGTQYATNAGQLRSQYAQGQQGLQMGAQQLGAGYSDQEFEYNVNQPFQRKYNQLNANNQMIMQMYGMDKAQAAQDAQNRQRNRAALWGAGLGIVGGIGGALIGGPAGAAAGYQVGSSVGNQIPQYSDQTDSVYGAYA